VVVWSEPVILLSAHKHGISEGDILHAWRNAIDVWEQDDDMTMLIGPDPSARLLEVGVVDSDQGPVIVHCMIARRKYLRR